MIVLTIEEGEAERLAEGAPTLQRIHGMPIDPRPYARTFSSEPACRAFVAARLHAPERADALLRRLRVRTMLLELLDEPATIAGAAADAGLVPDELAAWMASEDVDTALAADIAAARNPTTAARALDHKLSGPPGERRYSAPSYELTAPDGRTFSIPGFNPVEAYEAAIANLEPELPRRPRPREAAELLAWAGEPLATSEVALVMAADRADVVAELERTARRMPAGADAYWTL
jgi:hypothetical protein